MKKILLSALTLLAVVACTKFDDSEIWSELKDHEERIVKLESLCNQMNTNITSLQTIIIALQNNDYVTNIVPIKEGNKEIGYTITFAKSGSITIYHGQDGKDGEDGKDGIDGKDGEDGKDGTDGQDGSAPVIGVKQDADGIWYWTLNGTWLLDDSGNKIPTTGMDGQDGEDGKDGTNGTDGTDGKDGVDGTDGKDGITPQLKIEDGYWYLSYDNGSTWQKLGKATGNNGLDGVNGSDGEDGDSIIDSITQDEENVYFNLTDGTLITLPKRNVDTIVFEDLNVKALCCKRWDTNLDGELSYSEAAAVTSIKSVFSGASGSGNTNIIAFTELKHFTSLTEIPDHAFNNCSNLWKVSLPNSIKSIGNSAFKGCTYLSCIDVPSNVETIGTYAFSGTNISRLVLSDNISSLGEYVFTSCKFDYLYIGTGLVTASYPFRDAQITEIVFNSNVPNGSSSAYYDYGFFHYGEIDKITFSGEAKQIGSFAMGSSTLNQASLPGIKTVILDTCVEIIEERAFCNNTLTKVYCKSTTPPSGTSDMFSSSGTYKIYVPIGASEAYKAASGWKSFSSKIEEYDFESDPIE